MEKHGGRLLTEEDMKSSQHELSYRNELDKLAEVCRVAIVLYDQEISQRGQEQNSTVLDKSWGKRPVSDQEIFQQGQEQNNIVLDKSRGKRPVSNDQEILQHGHEQNSIVLDKSWGKRPVNDDQEILQQGLKQNYIVLDKSWGKRPVSNDQEILQHGHEQNSNFLDKSWGKRPVNDDQEILQQGLKRNYIVLDKSWGKRPVSDDQECHKTAFFIPRTCCFSGEKLLKKGPKKCTRENSSSSRYYKYTCDHDKLVEEKVHGKKKMCYGSKDRDFEYCIKKEKKARSNVKARNRVVETAPLPVEFENEIQRLGGNDVRLLIQKNITTTDVNPSENRFSIPNNQVREEAKDFLTEAEKTTLNGRRANNGIVSIEVPLLEPNLNRSVIKFKKWGVNSSFWYVLCGSWSVMQSNNNLEANTDIQVWSFRVNGALNLALVKVP